ncbi:MAG: glycosyltransferase [Candidatus Kapabacteria bacterium]|nr:glycosyltransferase [Candidatus Kapabacteria bacterium]
MVILHIIDTLRRGGTEILLLDTCIELRELKHTSIVYCSEESPMVNEFRENGIQVIVQKRTRSIDLQYLRRLREIVLQEGVDIVHCHQSLGTFYALIVLFKRVPIVSTIHSLSPKLHHRLLNSLVIRLSTANILVSSSVRSAIQRMLWLQNIPNEFVVYNGISSKRLQDVSLNTLRDELSISDSDVLLGMIGNFYYVKDQLTVCKAVNELHIRGVKVHCVFVGHGDRNSNEYVQCESYIQDNELEHYVHFLGERQDIVRILRSLDLFVFSTNSDTFGIALIEAMMLGIPSIASDIEVMREITCNGLYAPLFERKNYEQAADCIHDAISNTEKSQQRAISACAYVKSEFTIERHVQRMLDVYHESVEYHSRKK